MAFKFNPFTGNFDTVIDKSSSGDIKETSADILDNQAASIDVGDLAFSNAVVRSFVVDASIEVDATSDLFENITIKGIQKGAGWDISVTSVGDDSGVEFTITSAGQIQYTSPAFAGYASATIKFRATTTTV